MGTSTTSSAPFSRATRIIPSSSAPPKKPGFSVMIETRTRASGPEPAAALRFVDAGQPGRRLDQDDAARQIDRNDDTLEHRDQHLALLVPHHEHVVAAGGEDVGHASQGRARGGTDGKPDPLEAVERSEERRVGKESRSRW